MSPRGMSACAVVLLAAACLGCSPNEPRPGTVQDEAMRAGVTPEHFVRRDRRLLPRHGLQPRRRRARRPFTQGRDRRPQHVDGLDRRQRSAVGSPDGRQPRQLRSAQDDLVASRSATRVRRRYGRHNRWRYLGLVNEPCFKEATGPDPNRFGLWLDVRDPSCPPDPFADAQNYPGVKIGARGTTVAVGSYYGEPTGSRRPAAVPEPGFRRERARSAGTPTGSTTIPSTTPIAISCGRTASGCRARFCHVGPNPIKPPADPENPKWENLSSNVGAQYFWWDRVFNWRGVKNAKQLLLSGAACLASRARSIRRSSPPTTSTTRAR